MRINADRFGVDGQRVHDRHGLRDCSIERPTMQERAHLHCLPFRHRLRGDRHPGVLDQVSAVRTEHLSGVRHRRSLHDARSDTMQP